MWLRRVWSTSLLSVILKQSKSLVKLELVDFDTMLDEATKFVTSSGLSNYVSYNPSDAMKYDGAGDVFFCANLIHLFSADAAKSLLFRLLKKTRVMLVLIDCFRGSEIQ